MNTTQALAQGEITKKEIYSTFLANITELLSTSTLIQMAKELYQTIEPGPNWMAINAYHEVVDALRERGCTVQVERIALDDYEVVISPNGRIPY